ncbi:MAG: hypothetical protein IJJ73_06300 [Bacteroidaceae bacterium]|nr:hypothetical protein [Bacteroidaceae bacterium]
MKRQYYHQRPKRHSKESPFPQQGTADATAKNGRRQAWEFTEPGNRQVGPTPDVHAHSQNRRPRSAKVNFL